MERYKNGTYTASDGRQVLSRALGPLCTTDFVWAQGKAVS